MASLELCSWAIGFQAQQILGVVKVIDIIGIPPSIGGRMGNRFHCMKLLCATLVVVVATILPNCGLDSRQRIPVGVYEEPSGQERVTSKGETLEFQVRLIGGQHEGKIGTNDYSYQVLRTGEIHVISSSSGAVFMEGILPYEWFWDGNQIIRKRVEPSRDERGNMATKLGPPVIFARKTQEH
jgi:hypothetical protein